MTEKKRLANIELLRVLAMVMVVAMHFMRESGSLLEASAYEGVPFRQFLGTFLEAFCIVAVNTYVFISGYFGSEGSFKLSKVIGFLCRIWFYALLVPLVLTCFSVPTLAKEQGVYGIVKYLLPVESDTYWFASSYFLLLLLMPVLNGAVRSLDKKQLQMILLLLLTVFCFVKSICPVALPLDRYGYDLSWFICVYLLAAYLKKYGCRIFEKRSWEIYAGSCLLIFLLTVALWYSLRYFSGAAYYFTVPFHYNFVLCLAGAIGLFYGFLKINIREGRLAELLRKAGKYSFGIYLLHEHPDIRYKWYPFFRNIINPSEKEGIVMFLTELIFSLVILFAAGLLIEWIRNLLFERIEKVGRRIYAKRK
ncbi:MAG: acyltransferase family protein [Suilimivivens sp.]